MPVRKNDIAVTLPRRKPTSIAVRSLAAATLIGICACSTVYIDDDQRTTNPAFDGIWHGTITSSQIQLSPQNQLYFCDPIQQTLTLRVERGQLHGQFPTDKAIAFITNLNDRGRFYADRPKESTYLIDGRSRFGARENHVLKGLLNPQTGHGGGSYRDALGQIGSGGCLYEIEFMREGVSFKLEGLE